MILFRSIFFILLVIVSGCATRREKPSPPVTAAPRSPEVSTNQPAARHVSLEEALKAAASKPSTVFAGEGWLPLFDGKTLTGWRETDFAGRGEVSCSLGMLVFNTGDPFTGVTWTNSVAKMNYEIALDA